MCLEEVWIQELHVQLRHGHIKVKFAGVWCLEPQLVICVELGDAIEDHAIPIKLDAVVVYVEYEANVSFKQHESELLRQDPHVWHIGPRAVHSVIYFHVKVHYSHGQRLVSRSRYDRGITRSKRRHVSRVQQEKATVVQVFRRAILHAGSWQQGGASRAEKM